jgi:shikimate kinase
VKRHVVLVGLPGSGKTTIGRRVSQLLETHFSDLDEMVVAAAGMPVAEIFAVHGEAHFRRLERAAMDAAIAAAPHLIAPGAGWIAEPGNLEAAAGAVLIYLEISPENAAARLQGDTVRPLLADGPPASRLADLLAARERWYRRSAVTLDASAPPDAVTQTVLEAARRIST